MIISRKRYDQEDKLVKVEFAEIYDGDTFTDANGDWHSVSMSSEGDNPKSVLLGYAHDHHIEPMSVVTIMEHFRDDKIVRLRDAMQDAEFTYMEWRYYDAEKNDWVRFQDWRYAQGFDGIVIFGEDGETIDYPANSPVKLVR